MRNLLTIFLFLSLGAKAQVCCVLYTAGAAKDSMRVQMYITAADTVAGVSHCQGDPSTALRSVTGGNSGTITFATLTTANWGQSGGASIGANNGLTSTTTFPGLTGIMKEGVLNTNGYDTTKHMMQFSGLKASTSYTIKLAGVFGFNFNFEGKYNVAGSSWQTAQTLNCNGTTNPNPTALSWTLNSSSTGVITIAFGSDPGTPGSLLGGVNALIITEQ